ncbi:hypothetical protein R3P38DRAFT_2787963 [Favolaschia claudopus]|uniref:Uncharacterized protein n=1 Tax=Favolaschia claudopus TaxID=2862362 RepID=A0AAW0AL35_9AGAR
MARSAGERWARIRVLAAPQEVTTYPTLADKELPLTILDMRVTLLSKFIHEASTLQSPPYKLNETMSSLTRSEPNPYLDGGVGTPQQLDFAKSWKAAFEQDSPEGFHATMVEMYWDHDTGGPPRSRWLDDQEAVRVFLEGVDMAERRDDITGKVRTRLAAMRESLMHDVDVHETQSEGGSVISTVTSVDS